MISPFTTHLIWGAGFAFFASQRYTDVLSTGTDGLPEMVTMSGGTAKINY